MPPLRRAARADRRRPRQVAALPDRADDGAARASRRSSIRSTRRACERAGSCRSPSSCRRRDIFTEYAYFSAYSDSWVEHARRYVEMMTERLGLDARRASSSSSRRTTATCSSTSSRTGIPVLGIEPARNVAEAAVARGVPTLTEFFGPSSARRLGRGAGDGRLSCSATTSSRRSRTSTTSSRASRRSSAGAAPRRSSSRTSRQLLEHLEYDTIYHEHFSYFSLYSIRDDLRGAGARPSSTSRSSRPTVARCASSSQHADDGVRSCRRPSPTCSRARTRQGLRDPETYRRFAEGVRESKRALLDLLIDAAARGQAGRRLRSAGEGQHASQLLRHPHRPPRLHRRPEPVQAGQVHARDAHPDPPAGAYRGDAAGRHPDPPVEPRRGDQRPARVHGGVGRAARRADPDGDRLRARGRFRDGSRRG